MNIFKFALHVCARGHVHLCAHVSSESLWVILCVFIFGLQLVLPLWVGVCVYVYVCVCVKEDISVGMHVYLCCFLSRSKIATYSVQSVTEDVMFNLNPHVRHCPLAGLIFRALAEETVSIRSENDFFVVKIH